MFWKWNLLPRWIVWKWKDIWLNFTNIAFKVRSQLKIQQEALGQSASTRLFLSSYVLLFLIVNNSYHPNESIAHFAIDFETLVNWLLSLFFISNSLNLHFEGTILATTWGLPIAPVQSLVNEWIEITIAVFCF